MLKKALSILILPLLLSSGCVRSKIYRAELAARSAAEAREKTLQQEVAARKQEVGKLTETIGSLNRTVGNQEAELRHINAVLEERTQQMGKSASKLASEKMDLEKELEDTKAELDINTAALQQFRKARQETDRLLSELRDTLTAAFKDPATVAVTVEDDAVAVTMQDKALFDSKGLQLSLAAKPLLITLARVLTVRPELKVEVIAYTDNTPPKNGNLYDTWDWSLFRATNVVRALIQDYNVNANQLTPIGRGEFYPLASNDTAEGRQKNRRTVVLLHAPMPTGK